jgi:hypothetical protein
MHVLVRALLIVSGIARSGTTGTSSTVTATAPGTTGAKLHEFVSEL